MTYVECGGSAWRLVHVSRLWMAIAFKTSQLWRHIRVTHGSSSEHYSTNSSLQAAGTKESLDKAFKRSGQSPLHISIVLPEGWKTCVLLVHLLSSPHMSRCVQLQVMNLAIDSSQRCGLIMESLKIAPLPMLETLDITLWSQSRRFEVILNYICDKSPLRNLSISGRPDMTLLVHLPKLFHRLESFSYAGVGWSVTPWRPSPELFTSPTLKTVTLIEVPLYPADMPPTVVFPSVSTLSLQRFSPLALVNLQVPNLTTLNITNCSYDVASHPPFSVSVPELRGLTVIQDHDWRVFRLFLCPKLETLTLRFTDIKKVLKTRADGGIADLWVGDDREVYPKVLSLDHAMPGENIIVTLGRLVDLEELNFTNCTVKSAGGELLSALAKSDTKGAGLGLVPSLRKLGLAKAENAILKHIDGVRKDLLGSRPDLQVDCAWI